MNCEHPKKKALPMKNPKFYEDEVEGYCNRRVGGGMGGPPGAGRLRASDISQLRGEGIFDVLISLMIIVLCRLQGLIGIMVVRGRLCLDRLICHYRHNRRFLMDNPRDRPIVEWVNLSDFQPVG